METTNNNRNLTVHTIVPYIQGVDEDIPATLASAECDVCSGTSVLTVPSRVTNEPTYEGK